MAGAFVSRAERQSEIDKENRRLISNISGILRNKIAQPGDPRVQFNRETPRKRNKYSKILIGQGDYLGQSPGRKLSARSSIDRDGSA